MSQTSTSSTPPKKKESRQKSKLSGLVGKQNTFFIFFDICARLDVFFCPCLTCEEVEEEEAKPKGYY